MGYLWDRGNPQPIFFMQLCRQLQKTLAQAKMRMNHIWKLNLGLTMKRNFILILRKKNFFSTRWNTLFCPKKEWEWLYENITIFYIESNTQYSIVGEPKNVKQNYDQENYLMNYKITYRLQTLKKCTTFANIPVTISAHRILNSSKGFIRTRSTICTWIKNSKKAKKPRCNWCPQNNNNQKWKQNIYQVHNSHKRLPKTSMIN